VKKLLPAILLSILSASTVFAFTACNQGGGQQGEEAATPEDKWKKAFSYFTVDWDYETYYPILSDYPRTNFKSKYNLICSENGVTTSYQTNASFDYDKMASGLEFKDEDGNADATYGWKGGDVYYSIGNGWRLDSETGKKIKYYTKEVIDKEKFLMGYDSGIYSYAGGEHILALKLADKFADFTYSEEKGEYTATLYYESFATNADVTVKFENDKISYLAVSLGENEYDIAGYTCEYTYGITVTVPEFYLNLELGETIVN